MKTDRGNKFVEDGDRKGLVVGADVGEEEAEGKFVGYGRIGGRLADVGVEGQHEVKNS